VPPIRLVVGLGNPGPRYRGTRHNVGFELVERLERRLDVEAPRETADAMVWRAAHPSGGDLFLIKPLTFMNLSGAVLRQWRHKPWYGPETTLVCYDDIDLPLGQLRLRVKGSAGGHRGMLSCIEALGSEDIPRLRVGVGPVPPAEDAAEFVLSRFSPDQRRLLDEGMARAEDAVASALDSGFEAAMNRFNQRAKA
jgi:peptidyl-tRNA hydrolase, PTH1 family